MKTPLSFFSAKTLLLPTILCLVLLLGSCIEFKGQTLTFRYDSAGDRLLIFSVYHGIYATGHDPASSRKNKTGKNKKGRKKSIPTESEKGELQSAVANREAYFFDNWMLSYSNAKAKEALASAKKKVAAGTDKELSTKTAAMLETLLGSVQIKNGAFFLNPKKQLCAYQSIEVKNVKTLVPLINSYLSAFYDSEADKDFRGKNLELIQQQQQKNDWLHIESNRLRLKIPMSHREFIQQRMEPFNKPESMSLGKLATDQQVFFNYDEPFADIIVGRRGEEPITLSTSGKGKVPGNLKRWVKKKFGLDKSVDLPKLRQEFFKSGHNTPATTVQPTSQKAM